MKSALHEKRTLFLQVIFASRQIVGNVVSNSLDYGPYDALC
jgi:hypothetical protein